MMVQCQQCDAMLLLEDAEDDGFVLEGMEVQHGDSTWGGMSEVLARLYDMVSETASVETPLCAQCLDVVCDKMDLELEYLVREEKLYKNLLVSRASVPHTHNDAEFLQTEKHIASLEMRVQRMNQTVFSAEQHLDHLRSCNDELQALEHEFWTHCNTLSLEEMAVQEQYKAHKNRHAFMKKQHAMLSCTSVLDDLFFIAANNQYPTINQFRLGQLPGRPVDWEEVNAALGQSLLLLDCICSAMDLSLERYNLFPRGNYSLIERKSDGRLLELFMRKSIWFKTFDRALEAFLDCIKQVGSEMESLFSVCALPYPIQNDTISGYSIRHGRNQDTDWTKALKYTLITLKQMLACFNEHSSK